MIAHQNRREHQYQGQQNQSQGLKKFLVLFPVADQQQHNQDRFKQHGLDADQVQTSHNPPNQEGILIHLFRRRLEPADG